MSETSDQPLMDPEAYARLVESTADEDLEAGLRENGALILDQIFQAMPTNFKRDAAAGVHVVAEWRVRNRSDRSEARWQVVIDDGSCTVLRDGTRAPDITFSIGGLDFVKLVTANAKGPMLFLLGRLRIKGDLLKAARFQGYFRQPRARA
jgi:putative sterol carrier protein